MMIILRLFLMHYALIKLSQNRLLLLLRCSPIPGRLSLLQASAMRSWWPVMSCEAAKFQRLQCGEFFQAMSIVLQAVLLVNMDATFEVHQLLLGSAICCNALIVEGVSIREFTIAPGSRLENIVSAPCFVIAAGTQNDQGFNAGPVSLFCLSWN